MAPTDRVVSTRFTDSEFSALQSLSVLTGESLNCLIRRAVHEYVQKVVASDAHNELVEQAARRAIQAERELRRSIGVDTGMLPRITV